MMGGWQVPEREKTLLQKNRSMLFGSQLPLKKDASRVAITSPSAMMGYNKSLNSDQKS